MPTPNGLSTRSANVFMDVLGDCNNATIFAEYDVNRNNDDVNSSNMVRRADTVDGDIEKPRMLLGFCQHN